MTTLRTAAEVLAVLQAGGFVVTRRDVSHGYGMAALYDAQGQRVAAWQNAIKANIGPSRCRGEISSDIVRWWLP